MTVNLDAGVVPAQSLRVVWDDQSCRLIVEYQPSAAAPETLKRAHTGGSTKGLTESGAEASSALTTPASQHGSTELHNYANLLAKAKSQAETAVVKILNKARPGKKCLVLDIDGTIYHPFAYWRPRLFAQGVPRPHLHAFLTECYKQYDICIWSATCMRFVEEKMTEMGCLRHPEYRLRCLIDKTPMPIVHPWGHPGSAKRCKPLAFLWAKFPEYHEGNTIMLDDNNAVLVMNRAQGLLVQQFSTHMQRSLLCKMLCSSCGKCEKGDTELLRLAEYLSLIGRLDTFAGLNHGDWEGYVWQHGQPKHAKSLN